MLIASLRDQPAWYRRAAQTRDQTMLKTKHRLSQFVVVLALAALLACAAQLAVPQNRHSESSATEGSRAADRGLDCHADGFACVSNAPVGEPMPLLTSVIWVEVAFTSSGHVDAVPLVPDQPPRTA
jgi:hypothetical protein